LILALFPLLRFGFGVLSIAWGRGRRALLVMSHLVDGALIGLLAATFRGGRELTFVAGGWERGLGIALVGDRIGLTFAALAWGLGVAVSLYTWNRNLRSYFYMLLHLLVGACYALVFTKDLFNAYVIFELLTLTSFLLVAYERRPGQIWASLRYLFLASLGMGIFLLGVAVTYYHVGSLDLDLIAAHVAAGPEAGWIALASALLVSGVAVKAGVFSFALWLPSAHSLAMPAVSALLSGLVIKMGVVELFRLSDAFPLDLPLVVLGVLTCSLGILYAVASSNVKRLLAFHTISQIGYLLIGFGSGTLAARLGALDYAVAHGLFKALLFLAVGDAARAVGTTDIRDLTARRADIPIASKIALLIGVLGIVGMPPFAGFAAKAVLEAGLHSTVVHALVGLTSVGTVISFSKLIPLLTLDGPRSLDRLRLAAYAWLGGSVLFFLPLSRTMIPQSIWSCCWSGWAFFEALGAILLGLLLYRVLRHVRLRLPQRIFRIEEGVLVILGGFLLVFLLLRLRG